LALPLAAYPGLPLLDDAEHRGTVTPCSNRLVISSSGVSSWVSKVHEAATPVRVGRNEKQSSVSGMSDAFRFSLLCVLEVLRAGETCLVERDQGLAGGDGGSPMVGVIMTCHDLW